jgi:hypothetical protein
MTNTGDRQPYGGDQEPTGDVSFLEGHDPAELRQLSDLGIGEGDIAGGDHAVPYELIELHGVLEWENAVADADGRPLPHPSVGVPPPNTPGVERSTPFHSRADWGARPPKSVTAIPRPEGDTVHYGGPSPWPASADRSSPERFRATTSHDSCSSIVRGYQNFHMDSRGWADIAYNSLVCPHGHRYEGRGPGVRSAAQGTTDGNDRSYATCALTGDNDPLSDPMKLAYLDEGTASRLIKLVWGHRDWKSTACPGDPIYAWRTAGFPRPQEDDLPYSEEQIIELVQRGIRREFRDPDNRRQTPRQAILELSHRGSDASRNQQYSASHTVVREQLAGSGDVESGIFELAVKNFDDSTWDFMREKLGLPPRT